VFVFDPRASSLSTTDRTTILIVYEKNFDVETAVLDSLSDAHTQNAAIAMNG